ncbi:glycine zipper 2TM domain-containing protein [Rhodoferax sp.]|uniref:glycine zipper 2TM domain-containing protein n=1 Tax=Rhodoferax sp. TaxID=50421 RepID=UPI002731D05A|nr:glycine zipper 2TM domain-containing protein [Rhodoferax sp.]MDP1529848.1 glycine zipper 2TM domain-containing protein [Rhodoferax sp.]MDP1944540.1 glycine zipper 2TM domain-containing protein [Rhodoferax sp.]MDP2440675.1 glycine zipper 2TM domain-containing protein [Rhodoferax sp.]MDP3192205.1 glycine zipper 2TM domain-containing protein [Rhodoferax sp.]MDP3335439.1 glycine zipper 2TM domain-containing protein [Rhodoferax sp.]
MTRTSIPRSVPGWLACALLLGACNLGAQAQTPTANTPKARYEADKKLCADEASAEARLQCRRDAQAVYEKALAASKAAKTSSQAAVCNDCGRVTAIKVTEKPGESNALGMIAGGVAGAVLGNQVGGGTGKTLATVAGAAGGAYAGKKVQENMNASKVWTVSVRYNNGATAEFDYEQDPGVKVGDAVRKSGNVLVRN